MEKVRPEVDDCREKVRPEVEKLAWAMGEVRTQRCVR
jgi:hypothetical protein